MAFLTVSKTCQWTNSICFSQIPEFEKQSEASWLRYTTFVTSIRTLSRILVQFNVHTHAAVISWLDLHWFHPLWKFVFKSLSSRKKRSWQCEWLNQSGRCAAQTHYEWPMWEVAGRHDPNDRLFAGTATIWWTVKPMGRCVKVLPFKHTKNFVLLYRRKGVWFNLSQWRRRCGVMCHAFFKLKKNLFLALECLPYVSAVARC